MADLFIEKAFWFFAALIISLITVIYRLFNGSIKKDQEMNRVMVKMELIAYLDGKVADLKKEILMEFKDMGDKMEKDHEHLMSNVKSIHRSMENVLDQKHEEIEKIGNKYLNKIENR